VQRAWKPSNAGMGCEVTHLKISDPAAATSRAFSPWLTMSPSRNFLDWSNNKSDLHYLLPVSPSGPGNGDERWRWPRRSPQARSPALRSPTIKLETARQYTALAPLPFRIKARFTGYKRLLHWKETHSHLPPGHSRCGGTKLPTARALRKYQASPRGGVLRLWGKFLSLKILAGALSQTASDIRPIFGWKVGRASMNSGHRRCVQLLKPPLEVGAQQQICVLHLFLAPLTWVCAIMTMRNRRAHKQS